MKKSISFLILSLFCIIVSHAESILGFETGFVISSNDSPTSVVTSSSRSQRLYIHGDLYNISGRTQNIRVGVEMVNTSTQERYFDNLFSITEWQANAGLAYFTFYPNFIIRNGSYEIRPIYTTYDKDETKRENWEYISLGKSDGYPTLRITGDDPVAYLPSLPYVGKQNNITTIADTELHLSLTSISELKNAELFAFVFKSDQDTSIGYYPIAFNQAAEQTQDYTATYKPDGSKPAELQAGKTYTVNIRLFLDDKEYEIVPSNFTRFTFQISENGSDIELIETPESQEPRKIMLKNGQIIIMTEGNSYDLQGRRMND